MRILCLALAVATLGRAEQICPWFNSATAAGVLGGPVKATVTQSACEFTRQGSVSYTLRIEVTNTVDFKSWLAQCGPKAIPIRGIGNQAVACDLTNGSQVSAQVLSRVRERAFLVRVSANRPSAPLAPLREQARGVADHVSGNLF